MTKPEEDIERMAKAMAKEVWFNDEYWDNGKIPPSKRREYMSMAHRARAASHLPEQLAAANKQLKEQDDQLKGMALENIDANLALMGAEERVKELDAYLKNIHQEVYTGFKTPKERLDKISCIFEQKLNKETK